MNNTMKLTAVAATAAVALVAYTQISKSVTLTMLEERYPTIDPKIAKVAYRRVMRMAMSGKIDMSNWSEEQFNALFLQEVATCTTK
jgi:hypothetical protein